MKELEAGQMSPVGGYAVQTTGLTKRFGGRVAVDRVDLRVPAGTAFGYLGPNGAGETTLIRMPLGPAPPGARGMEVLGIPPARARAAAAVRGGGVAGGARGRGH